MTAKVRIFLATHHRPGLLRRALTSLLKQSESEWICELHNDAPDDDAPRAILADLAPGDPRFIYRRHETNWGAVAMFNHVYAGGPEPFASLLEDDNWWEPDCLRTLLRVLDSRPDAALAWANMKMWLEECGGEWTDTERTIWGVRPDSAPVVEFRWPELYQAFDALHSQGAMVFRPGKFFTSGVPPSTPLAIIEMLRERSANGPLLLLTAPLAHFAITRETARDADAGQWLQAKLLVAASFFRFVSYPRPSLDQAWATHRAQRPRDTGIFFSLAVALGDPRLLSCSRLSDWSHFLMRAARHPLRLLRGLKFRREGPEVWSWLLTETQRQGARMAHCTVSTKQVPP